ncbi:MAG: DoxX family protein [Leptospirales bacterium]
MNFLTGRFAQITFSIPFLVFGAFHLMDAGKMAGMVPIPGGVFWVYLTGVAMIAAAVSIIIQKYTYWACMGLALLMLIFIVALYVPKLPGQMAIMSMLKDVGLLGGALMLAGKYKP